MSRSIKVLTYKQLEQEYIEMAKDKKAEREAYEWIEGCIGCKL
jgi:hypothetical protein